MSHTFCFLSCQVQRFGIFPGIMCPTVIGAPGSYALQIGEVHTTMVFGKVVLPCKGGTCVIARARWFQIVLFLPFNLGDDPKIDFCNFWAESAESCMCGPKMCHLQREVGYGVLVCTYWNFKLHTYLYPSTRLSCIRFFLSLY